jgi:fatty acid desaturase
MSYQQHETLAMGKTVGLLHYRQDRRSLLFLLVTLTLLMTPFFVPPTGLAAVPWISLSTLFCFNACIINHNHIHHPTLRNRWLNEVFGHLLGLAKGHTSIGVLVAHNLNHHRFHGGAQDWIRPSLAGRGPGIVRLVRYVIGASVSMAHGRNAAAAPQLPERQKRQQQRERVSLWLFMGVLLWLDWRCALLFVFLPWGLGMAMLTGVNLLQHDGCEPVDPYRRSRNFTGRLGNWFFLNNGFHTAHHLQPQMHWSRLRRFHEQELAGKIPEQLNRGSILAYLFGHYLFAFRNTGELA